MQEWWRFFRFLGGHRKEGWGGCYHWGRFWLREGRNTCVENGLMGDEIFELMRPVLFYPGDVFGRLGSKGDFRIVWLDIHFHLSFMIGQFYTNLKGASLLLPKEIISFLIQSIHWCFGLSIIDMLSMPYFGIILPISDKSKIKIKMNHFACNQWMFWVIHCFERFFWVDFLFHFWFPAHFSIVIFAGLIVALCTCLLSTQFFPMSSSFLCCFLLLQWPFRW